MNRERIDLLYIGIRQGEDTPLVHLWCDLTGIGNDGSRLRDEPGRFALALNQPSYFRTAAPPPMSTCRSTAVDYKNLPGHERGLVRCQVQGQKANLVGLADAPDRLGSFDVPAMLLVLPEKLAEVGLNQARGDGVDAHTLRTELLGVAAGHHD